LAGDAMNPSVYARDVVAKVVKANPPEEIWCGSGATTIWFIETLGIRWVYSIFFSRLFGLDLICPQIKKEV
jgi:1-acylglycerone phosphate reductase